MREEDLTMQLTYVFANGLIFSLYPKDRIEIRELRQSGTIPL